MDIAVGTGSIAMGLVSQYWGYTVFFLIATAIFLISLVLYLLLLGRLEHKSQERIRIEYCEPCEKLRQTRSIRIRIPSFEKLVFGGDMTPKNR